MKTSLTTNDLMIQVDFAESYKNEQQDTIQQFKAHILVTNVSVSSLHVVFLEVKKARLVMKML